jgi:hypothetical protein
MSFGIRQTFRTQSISRKVARTNSTEKDSVELKTEKSNNTDNIFESNQNFFVNNVVNRTNLYNLSDLNKNTTTSESINDTNRNVKKTSSRLGARLNLLKNHNKGVTKSEDHF